MNDWIDRATAVARLRVKPQTLYAYASRGLVRMQPDPADARRSLYSAEDIAQLTTRRARGRRPAAIAASSMAWGEPAIATSLSTVRRGVLLYRGRDAVELARTATLEEIAALLWEANRAVTFAAGTSASGTFGAGDPFAALAALVPESRSILHRSGERLVRDAEAIVGLIAASCGAAPGDGPVHARLAEGWGCAPAAADNVRQALVLMADHDLNASTFATRVAASTGASLAASVLAGLCAFSGPRHGGAAAALAGLVADARSFGAETAVARWLDRDAACPGFGHPLYPSGDPRGRLLLENMVLDDGLRALRGAVFDMTGALPNCDFGLTAMVEAYRLPADAPFRLFLIGRSVGWCAHAMEQARSGALIRPRGRYVGPDGPE